MRTRTQGWAAAALAAAVGIAGGAAETPEQRDARMAWWREAKCGMFIHWGVYAVPAGIYNGQQIAGIGEWIMLRAKIPVAEYRAFARQFNPVKYDPEAWVRLAKRAGMRYIVITSKHHDGFALFDSAVTDWDVVDATPYGRDLLAPLAAAARRHGLKFGCYYSQAQDWTHPGGAKSGYPDGGGWDEAHKGSFDRYLAEIAVPQTREVLTKFQPDILWWDTPHLMTAERAAPLHALIALRPGLITNDRLGGGYEGDTETPEQYIPATGFKGRDWEVCMTMNDTWGYKSYDHNWKSTETLVRNLIDIVSKGGNYLLNVGPTAEGEIPAPSVERLEQVGAWMDQYGEAIYGTIASPFRNLRWGRCTRKVKEGVTTLYLHVFDWPADGRLVIEDLPNEVIDARLVGGGAVAAERNGSTVVLAVPAAAPNPIASVVALRVRGEVATVPWVGRPAADGTLMLPPEAAETTGKLATEGRGLQRNLGFWTDPADHAIWLVELPAEFRGRVEFEAAAVGASKVVLVAGEDRHEIAVPDTRDYRRYTTVKVENVRLPAGRSRVELRAVAEGWRPVNVRTLKFTAAR
ncbi:MAG: alpha-L-fucosidase [Kiritimatiellae bacterium]|nr:alpha-L-fucosidase [Kiritimatiellia bacterium]